MRIFIFVFMITLTLTGTAISLVTYLKRVKKNTTIGSLAYASPIRRAVFAYQDYIDASLCRSGTPGAALAIVKGDSVVLLKGFGVRDKDTKALVNTHTVFRLASVSKPFTAMLAGTLVEDSLLDWDDSVLKYWPDLSLNPAEQTDKLQIKHLLSHTTGFPYHAYTNLVEEGKPLSVLMEKLTDLDLVSRIGEQYNYQNVAFSIMDKVVEGATGDSFEHNMKERIFIPLGMRDASISYSALADNNNIAFPHVRYRTTWKHMPLSSSYYNVAPAGGINASISDMARWLKAMLGNAREIIAPHMIRRLFRPAVKADPKNKNFNLWHPIKRAYYGLGWRILCFERDTIAYHGGYIKGYRSEVVIYPKEKIGICLLTNGAGDFANKAVPAFLSLYDKYRDATGDTLSSGSAHAKLDTNTSFYKNFYPLP